MLHAASDARPSPMACFSCWWPLPSSVFFVRNSAPGMESTFKLNPTTKEKVIQLGDLVLPTYQTLIVLATIVGLLGLYQVSRGFKRVVLVLGIVALLFVFAFLVWAVRDKSINLLGILTFTVAAATPIAFGAMSGVMCERSGVINIAIEGMMLTGAMVAVIFSSITGSLWLGLVGAVIASGLLGVFLAILAIHFRVDQIIAGTAINIFALGITSFISQRFLQPNPGAELRRRLLQDRHPRPVADPHPRADLLQPVAHRLHPLPDDHRHSLHAVLHPLGPAHPGRGRAPTRGRHAGRQRLQDPLRQRDHRRHDRRRRRRLLHHRLGGALRRSRSRPARASSAWPP